jgi:hypothetical protein
MVAIWTAKEPAVTVVPWMVICPVTGFVRPTAGD